MKRLLGNDPQQEARVQNILLDRLEARFSRRFEIEIASASKSMLADFERTGGHPVLPLEHVRRVEGLFLDLAAVSIDVFGGRILDQGKSAGLILETKGFAEFFQRLAEEYIQLEAIRQRIVGITETTRRFIINQIASGQEDGLGTDAIARSISDRVEGISRTRAHIISRTETHGAANYGANEAAKATGLKLRKEWVSVEDHRTRDFGQSDGDVDEYDHRGMNGQVVDMDQPFLMPWKKGDPLRIMHPGQAGMPPGATINCRCAVAHIVDDAALFE